MSKIVRVPTIESALGEGRVYKPDAAILLAGDPTYTSWPVDDTEGRIRTGIWKSEPGKNISRKIGLQEVCVLLQGRCIITEDGGDAHEFKAGDVFVMKPGFTGTWETLETLVKLYVTVDI